MFKAWIKKAESNGWVFDQLKGSTLTLRCGVQGCTGKTYHDLNKVSDPPAPCTKAHVNGFSQRLFNEHKHLVRELQRRRRQIGLSQADLDDALGLADGYVAKLESFARIPQGPTLLMWCQSLGVKIELRPAQMPVGTLAAIERRKNNPYREQNARFAND